MLQSSVDIDFPHVTDVRHVGGHIVWLRFSDGVEGHVDFARWPDGGVFDPLRDAAFVAQVRLEHSYTIAWPNGADIAPEALYERLSVTGAVQKRDYAQLFGDAARREAAECAAMPEISRFFGMVIHMFWREHEAPHFHARYGEFVASIDISTGAVTTRKFPDRALRLVQEWRNAHQAELLANWDRMRRREQPLEIPPLE
jgi:hypothetical protein